MTRWMTTAALVVLLAVTGGARAARRLPVNIQVPEKFRAVVEHLLEASPTFLQQCQRIGSAVHVRVVIEFAAPSLRSLPRAHARITRYEFGALLAEIRIPVGRDLAELLGHELEHVLEQMEGVKLVTQARQGRLAYYDASRVFESARAQAVGERVAAEVEIARERAAAMRSRVPAPAS